MSFKFYSGFSLEDDEELFEDYLVKNDFTVAGFSYGAIKAFEDAYNSKKRVDALQLISPAFFQQNDEKFKKMQLLYFKKDSKKYCFNFLNNMKKDDEVELEKYFKEGTFEQLKELLYYEWSSEKLEELEKRGTKIELFLGSEDKIVDTKIVKEFFKEFVTVYYIKKCGHLLKGKI